MRQVATSLSRRNDMTLLETTVSTPTTSAHYILYTPLHPRGPVPALPYLPAKPSPDQITRLTVGCWFALGGRRVVGGRSAFTVPWE